MSLEKILQALETEAEREITEIEQAAQTEIENIHAQAEKKATALQQQHLAEARRRLELERVRRLNQAKLEALRIELSRREELIDSVLEAAARCLAELAAADSYPALLQCLVQEAIEMLGADDELKFLVLERDIEVMKRVVEEMGLAATVAVAEEGAEISPWGRLGGLVALMSDQPIRLTNTLEVRLQRVAYLHRAQIAEILFNHAPEV